MNALPLACWFLGGAFLANAVPHFVSGIMGRPFQSPFAKPPGEGLSPSTVNVLWGLFNMAAGYALVCHVGNFSLKRTPDAIALGLGILAISLPTARRFGRFNGGHSGNNGGNDNGSHRNNPPDADTSGAPTQHP